MKNRILHIALNLLFFNIFLISCGQKESEQTSVQDEHNDDGHVTITTAQFEASEMKTGAIQQQPFSRQIKANGHIDVPPERMASVSVRLGGFVKVFSILPGNRVTNGSVLFTLENPEFIQLQQDYMEAKAQLHYLESDYERQKSLASENISSQKNFLKAESDFKVTQARYLGLKEKLKLMNVDTKRLDEGVIESNIHVYAPISGYISKVNITRGMFVHPADVAVEIIDTDHMHVELQVFEKDIVDIKKGQSLTFTIPGSGTHIYNGEIYLIGKTIEHEARTINIHGHIDEEQTIKNLLPGMYVEASISITNESRMVLPSEAVVAMDDKHYVLIQVKKDATSYSFEKREIAIGEFNNQWTEVNNLSDFKNGDVFLVKGAFNLINEEGGGHDH